MTMEQDEFAVRCWEEKYRGDSRQWLLQDGRTTETNGSETKAAYVPRGKCEVPLGARRAQLVDRLWRQAQQEVMEERSQPPPVEPYCTEYDGNYSREEEIGGEDSEEIEALCEKYPLYASAPATRWQQLFLTPGRGNGQRTSNGFKRCTEFTKPLDQVLDEPFVPNRYQ